MKDPTEVSLSSIFFFFFFSIKYETVTKCGCETSPLQLVYTHAIEFYYNFQLRSERQSIIAYVAHKRFLKRNTPTIRVSKEIVTNECQELAFSSTSTSKFKSPLPQLFNYEKQNG